MQDQHMVQAFLSYAPQEALTDGIGPRRVIGRYENLDATCPRHPSKAGPTFGIVITDVSCKLKAGQWQRFL
jgi:hypothetical protein